MELKTEELENQPKDIAGNGIETEEFPDDFRCCVCLDLLYKPVVLACGHISCFWCVFNAMDTWQGSNCPVCRHPYNHFPSICQLLHFLLLKLYPLAYKRREREVREEENTTGFFSTQFDDYLSASHPSKESDNMGGFCPHSTTTSINKLHLESCSSGEGEPSLVKDSSEMIVPDKDTMSIPTKSSYEATRNVIAQENSTHGNKLVCGTCSQVLISDLLCAVCNQLLCRPIVLNCGHVYCEACIINPGDDGCRCQICQSAHPNVFPKVCLVLEHFLEEQFSEEYAARKEAVLKQADCQYGSPSTCSTQGQQHAARSSSILTKYHLSWWSGQGPKIHFAVGCDFCGMYPIIGERYRCKDCMEKMGFDLCEGCDNSSSKRPGRFNQQHTPEHKFEILQPQTLGLLRIEAGQTDEDVSEDPEVLADVSPAPVSSGDALLDPEDGSAAPISSNDTSEDLECTDSTTENHV